MELEQQAQKEEGKQVLKIDQETGDKKTNTTTSTDVSQKQEKSSQDLKNEEAKKLLQEKELRERTEEKERKR